jgi:hypothetical protein
MASASRTISTQSGSDVTTSVQGRRVVKTEQTDPKTTQSSESVSEASKTTTRQSGGITTNTTREDVAAQITFTLKLDVGVGTTRFV